MSNRDRLERLISESRRSLDEGFTPLGEFRVRNPQSYKLVRDIEKEHKRYIGFLRDFFVNQHNKEALRFVMLYSKLKTEVETAGLKMKDVFPGMEKARQAQLDFLDDRIGIGELIKANERKKNQDLNHEFNIGGSPVPKDALKAGQE